MACSHLHPFDPEALLKQRGLSITAPRMAVLRALHDNPHVDAGALFHHARELTPALSRQAVYDNLNALTQAGLVRVIQPMGHAARYETRVCDNHHHIVCRTCGVTRDVDCMTGPAPCLSPADNHGFAVDEAEIIFWGACPSCQKSEPQLQLQRSEK